MKSDFYAKFEKTCYQKILLNDEIVGFWGYDKKDYIIDNVFIKIINKAQNRGVGTALLTNLISLSKEYNIPVKVVVIKTNPAQNLYKRMGFQLFKEEDVFYYFMYHHKTNNFN